MTTFYWPKTPQGRPTTTAQMTSAQRAALVATGWTLTVPAQDPTHWIVQSEHYWGRGRTVTEAVLAAGYLRGGEDVLLVPCDALAHVDDFGTLHRAHRWPGLARGKLRRVINSRYALENVGMVPVQVVAV